MFLDIVEQVNVLMNSKGSVLRCDVNGKMIMKAYLSGMPEVKIGLNDRLEVREILAAVIEHEDLIGHGTMTFPTLHDDALQHWPRLRCRLSKQTQS